ncbi:MAG TPA: dienelactone hydrolase family protein [Planctomycetota bacterium]|nr:dienelactone hydrolase family protein [Planctomycetota bacterium]
MLTALYAPPPAEPVAIQTPDGVIDADVFVPALSPAAAPLPGILFFMDALAIRPALRDMAARLASYGYAVILPNLYYRLGPTGSFPPFDPLKVRDTPGERERMVGMMRTLTSPKLMEDANYCLGFLGEFPGVNADLCGCVGYCMGGGMALTAAGTFTKRVKAAASFHGGSLATDKPDSPHLLAPKIKAKLYIGVAELDAMFSAEQGQKLQEALRAAHVDFQYEVYPGVKHGFAVTGHSAYDAAMSERHWDRLTALFKATLQA